MTLPLAWRQALPGFLLALVALLALYFGTGASIVEIWNRSETFAHGYVVVPISLWLIWRRRHDLAALTPRPALAWLLPLACCGLLWLLGDFVAANAVTQFAFVFMLILLVPLWFSAEVAWCIAFPLGFLLFGVPFGDFLTPLLMEHTANFAVAALRLSGIPVYREGLSFIIPSGAWSVVQACSGIRYLMASVMVGTLFAYLNYASAKKRWIFLVVSIVTPIVANWLRAYMIVMLGHLSGNTLAVGVDHLIYGWVFFGVIMFAMFMVGARWTDPEVDHAHAQGQAAVPPPAWQRLALVGLLSFVALVLPVVLRGQAVAHEAKHAPVLDQPQLAGWESASGVLPVWTPDFENAAASLQTEWRRADGAVVGMYVGYYRQQGADSKLVTSTNVLVNAETNKIWSEVESHTETVGTEPRQVWRAAELRGAALGALGLSTPVPRLQAWQIYWINGRALSSEWQAKLLGAWDRLMGRGDDAAVVVVYTLKSDTATALLHDFVQTQWPALDTWMRGVRDRGQSQ